MAKKRGRRPNNPPCKRYGVYMTEAQAKLLRMWGHGDVSAGLRWLIDTSALLVKKSVIEEKK